jgi:dihydropteroate synthase
VRLTLGTQGFDVTTRALVMGTVSGDAPPEQASRLTADGAQIIEIRFGDGAAPSAVTRSVEAVRAAVGPEVAIAAAVTGPGPASAGLGAGAVLVGTPEPGAPLTGLLPAIARNGAAVIVSAAHETLEHTRARLVQCAREAESAGIPPERIVVEAVLTRPLIPHVRQFAELGYPLLVTVSGPVLEGLSGDHAALPGNRAALTALSVIGGCRLVRTDDVRGAARVARVIGAVLEAR